MKISYFVIPPNLPLDAQVQLDFLYREPGEERFRLASDPAKTLSQDEAYLQESAGQLVEIPKPLIFLEINPQELAPFALGNCIWLLDPRTKVSLQGGRFIGKFFR